MKEGKDRYMGGVGGRKGEWCNYIIISINKRSNLYIEGIDRGIQSKN